MPTEEEPDALEESGVDHQAISKQVEELSSYLEKVEEEIQKLLKESSAPRNSSALEVNDLNQPPLTER